MFDASLASPNATSYLTVADATAILGSLPQSAGVVAWLALTEAEKEQSLNGASMVLDPLAWKGQSCSCEQRLAWPRQIAACGCPTATCGFLPFDIQLATAYLASDIGATGGGYIGSGTSGGGATGGLDDYSRVTIGPITVEMKPDSSTNTDSSNFGRLPAFVADLIGKYINGVGGIGQTELRRTATSRVRVGAVAATAWSGTMQMAWAPNGTRLVMPRPENGGWASYQAGTSTK